MLVSNGVPMIFSGEAVDGVVVVLCGSMFETGFLLYFKNMCNATPKMVPKNWT